MAKADRIVAPTRSCGTRTNLNLAMTDSTMPITTASASMPAMKIAQSASAFPLARGRATLMKNRTENEQFQGGSVEDNPEGGSTVIQNHDLMNHGQFQVRVGVIKRDAAVFPNRVMKSAPTSSSMLAPDASQIAGVAWVRMVERVSDLLIRASVIRVKTRSVQPGRKRSPRGPLPFLQSSNRYQGRQCSEEA